MNSLKKYEEKFNTNILENTENKFYFNEKKESINIDLQKKLATPTLFIRIIRSVIIFILFISLFNIYMPMKKK